MCFCATLASVVLKMAVYSPLIAVFGGTSEYLYSPRAPWALAAAPLTTCVPRGFTTSTDTERPALPSPSATKKA
jgi:hypothetical protein